MKFLIRSYNTFLGKNTKIFVFLLIISTVFLSIYSINKNSTFINYKDEIDKSKINNNAKINKITKIHQTPHDPISINGYDDFKNQAILEGWLGNGSINNPLLICNYTIETNGVSGITILNANFYFKIENITILGSMNENEVAFRLYNVVHGELTNNIVENCNTGFLIEESNKVTIKENQVINCTGNGIYIIESDYNTIIDNQNFNCRIYIRSSNNNLIKGNTVHEKPPVGFYIYNSASNIFSDNLANNCSMIGFRFKFILENNIIRNNTAKNSMISGFEFYIAANVLNNKVEGNKASNNGNGFLIKAYNCNFTKNIASNNLGSGFKIENTNHCNLTLNNATNNGESGYSIYECKKNTFDKNYSFNNGESGFLLSEVSYTILKENIVMNNSLIGIKLDHYLTNYNILIFNNISYNSNYGLKITSTNSENNLICLNTFIGNNRGSNQVIAYGKHIWDNGTHGNYWSDYSGLDSNGDGIGDEPYYFDGAVSELDNFPLIIPLTKYNFSQSIPQTSTNTEPIKHISENSLNIPPLLPISLIALIIALSFFIFVIRIEK